jgi:prophage maintenance system killer protein
VNSTKSWLGDQLSYVLAINDVALSASADSAYAFIDGLHEAGSFRFEELAKWLRAHTEKA